MSVAGVALRPLRTPDAPACDGIVASLPYHFGDVEGREMCARTVRASDGLVAVHHGEVVGFLTWRSWYAHAVEITWMAVHADMRRRGVGTALVDALAADPPEGRRFQLVTTLSEATPEPGGSDTYAGTRAFYQRHGFEPVWDPPGWWNERNQAVLMVRVLLGSMPA